MLIFLKYTILFILPLPVYTQGQHAGDVCILKTTNERAICNYIDKCEYAINLLKSKKTPQLCGFGAKTPIVCCPFGSNPRNYTKCFQNHTFNEKNEKGISFNKNAEDEISLITVANGRKSLAEEFPHMAVLGYGDLNDKKWYCGGTLISEKFLLTAAHCLYHPELGTVKFVRLGDLDLNSTTDKAQPVDYNVAKIHQHPKFNSSFYYNDIALIELDQIVRFNNFIQPACLYTYTIIPTNTKGIITGWGRTSFLGDQSSHLLKAFVEFLSHADCTKAFSRPDERLPNGIIEDIQLCAGTNDGKDTCPGDSGGPIQVRYFDKEQSKYYYMIVGVTSFGKGCGVQFSSGVYTKLAPYIDWIENVVGRN